MTWRGYVMLYSTLPGPLNHTLLDIEGYRHMQSSFHRIVWILS